MRGLIGIDFSVLCALAPLRESKFSGPIIQNFWSLRKFESLGPKGG